MTTKKVIRKINETDKEFEGRVNLFLAENLYAHVDAKSEDAVTIVYNEVNHFDPRWT